MEAISLPQTMENGGIRVTNSRSIVWRSRSPLIAPAVRAGVTKAIKPIWNRTR